MKICKICKLEKDFKSFYKNGERLRPECKACTDIKQRAAAYNISVEQLQKMYEDQNYACAICKKNCSTNRNLSIDHDHRCCPTKATSCGKCIRGLLCASCNLSLGAMEESIERFYSAIDYLLRYINAPIA